LENGDLPFTGFYELVKVAFTPFDRLRTGFDTSGRTLRTDSIDAFVKSPQVVTPAKAGVQKAL
jgi:hypothetical protein